MITCFVKKMINTYASTSTEKYSAIILHKTPMADILSQVPSSIAYSESSTQAPITSPHINQTAVTTGAKDTNVHSSLLSTLKITESPTRKQRTEKSEKED